MTSIVEFCRFVELILLSVFSLFYFSHSTATHLPNDISMTRAKKNHRNFFFFGYKAAVDDDDISEGRSVRAKPELVYKLMMFLNLFVRIHILYVLRVCALNIRRDDSETYHKIINKKQNITKRSYRYSD